MPPPPQDASGIKTQAVIFDLDGTLVDNMELHAEAFAHFTKKYGLPDLTDQMRRKIDGKRNRDIFPILFDDPLDPATIKSHTLEKESLYRELAIDKLKPVPGLLAFLDHLRNKAIPFAVATSAPEANVVFSLKALGMEKTFDVIVRGDQVPRGKPFPDVFLEASKQLDCTPEGCLVFEDAPAGIEAGLAAGMRCAALTTSFSAAVIHESVTPHFVVNDYDDVLKQIADFGLGS